VCSNLISTGLQEPSLEGGGFAPLGGKGVCVGKRGDVSGRQNAPSLNKVEKGEIKSSWLCVGVGLYAI